MRKEKKAKEDEEAQAEEEAQEDAPQEEMMPGIRRSFDSLVTFSIAFILD